jgi:hypothetical protein
LRTPATTFSRLNGSTTPERFTTSMLMVSTVVNRWLQDGQSRRRRMAVPSSVERESTTRVSADRQNGQYIRPSFTSSCA